MTINWPVAAAAMSWFLAACQAAAVDIGSHSANPANLQPGGHSLSPDALGGVYVDPGLLLIGDISPSGTEMPAPADAYESWPAAIQAAFNWQTTGNTNPECSSALPKLEDPEHAGDFPTVWGRYCRKSNSPTFPIRRDLWMEALDGSPFWLHTMKLKEQFCHTHVPNPPANTVCVPPP